MDPFEQCEIANTGIKVTRLGFGGASLGNMYKPADNEEALGAISTAYSRGVRYFDTAPLYGYGKSERLYGTVLKEVPRESFVLSTKIGRLIVDGDPTPETEKTPFVDLPGRYPVFDFSRDGILRSLEESLERLQLDRVDIIYIHDPDVEDCYEQAIKEAYPTLEDLRRQKIIGAIGAGMNQAEMLTQFAREGDFDCFLLAGRYTLLDQIALDELLPLCFEKEISIIIGGAYNSGILATGAREGAHYNYQPAQPAPPEIIEKTKRIEKVCARYHVPLKAAALQFPFGHPAVVANIPGTRSKGRFEENLALFRHPIPPDLWDELREKKLISEKAPLPSSPPA
jgi:D-threo-aldose 1-dehydrogenase